jgi:UDP:flavonoid glycosyltransferase YjiC (YdhE family)
VLAATAGKVALASVPANARVADYLPGEEAARRAALVVCNGGSPTSHQALAAGVPVLGIAGNLDQFLNMQGIVEAGAGALLRADRFDGEALRQAVQRMLETPAVGAAARTLMLAFEHHHASESFSKLLSKILTTR